MATTGKVLGQAALTTTTLTDVYTVPAATEATISTIIVANRGSGDTTFRISVAVAGAADATKQYLFYDDEVIGNKSFIATLGITLGAGDIIRAYGGNGNLSVNIFGVEIS